MNIKPIMVLRFEKVLNDRTVECSLRHYDDGSVGVFGDEIGTWMFEFTDEALDLAIAQVEKEGYVRIQ